MFGFIKPAHVQMRAALPNSVARDFDHVLSNVETAVPSWYDKGSRERAIAIAMGWWIKDRVSAGDFSLPKLRLQKITYLLELAHRFNERDFRGDGRMATVAAHDFIRAMREFYDSQQKSEASSLSVIESAHEASSQPLSEAELDARKNDLDERLRQMRASRDR